MQWRHNLLLSGFLFITLGILLLWSTSTLSEGGVFFIFPFFFFGGSDILGLVIVLTLALVFFIIVLRASSMVVQQVDSQTHLSVRDNFIPIGSQCVHCSKPIPINASFCSFCGSPVEQNDESANRI